ncbi:ankyrin repeat protein [Saudi moumouvirus]|nr:ankyrin repeat protein [Saudi moumouvirus]
MNSKNYFLIVEHNTFLEKKYDFTNKISEYQNNTTDLFMDKNILHIYPVEYLCRFLNRGDIIYKVIFPTNDPSFNLIKHPEKEIYIANLITLGKVYCLSKRRTWKYLMSLGMNIHLDNDDALITVCSRGYLKIAKFLIKNGADINTRGSAKHHNKGMALAVAVFGNHLETTKYLIENGVKFDEGILNIAKVKGDIRLRNYLNSLNTNK